MWLRTLILSTLLFCLGFLSSSAKDYEIPKIRVEVSINADGTVQITEHLTYKFEGYFTWADYRLPKKGYSAITDIHISEGEKSYINENSESPGTFSVAENEEAIKVTWYYEADNEKRTFTVSYTLQDALTVGSKWAQFYWNFLSDSRDKSTNELDITINLPESVSVDSLYGWTRTRLGRIDLQKNRGKLTVHGEYIDDDDFAKVRTLFPTSLLRNPEITDPNFSLNQAKEQEQGYEQRVAELQEWQRYWEETGSTIHYITILLAVAIFYFLYRRYGKRHSTSHLSDTETIMIPGSQRPAAMGWLLSGTHIKTRSVHLISTVLDLARRGYFKIREEVSEEGTPEDEDPSYSVERTDQTQQDDLLKWERDVIEFVEQRLEEGYNKINQIFEGSDSDVSGWFSEWKKQLNKYCFDQNWIDLNSYTGAYWNAGIQVVLFFITIGLIFYAGQKGVLHDLNPSYWISWFAALLTTLIAAVFSLAIIRPTQEGEETKHEWNNYKKGLQNAKQHSISSEKLDKHFIYGLAFGLKEDELENIFAEYEDQLPVYAWIVFSSHPSSAAAMASSFSTLAATGAASAPGAAGGAAASASAAGGGAAASAG